MQVTSITKIRPRTMIIILFIFAGPIIIQTQYNFLFIRLSREYNQQLQDISHSTMKQASSTTKVIEQPMTKTKKLQSGKSNIIQQRQSSRPFERLKSNDEQPLIDGQGNKPIKPRSSMGRRPASSQKYIEPSSQVNSIGNSNSLVTSSSAKSQQQVKQLIGNIFQHSKKLHSFISQNSLDQTQALQSLVTNQLFTLSLITMLSNKNPQQTNKYVQRSCIHKLDRILAMEKQKKICENIQNRIQSLINMRIKALSHF